MATSEASEQIRVLLVDDLVLFRQSLRHLLECQKHVVVVGEAGDGLEAVQKAHDLMPDIVLLDVRMPKRSGLAALNQIQRDLPAVKVIMLTVSEEGDDLFEAVKAGARGYLLKTASSDDLLRAVEDVYRGGAVVSPQMAVKLLAEFATNGAGQMSGSNVDAPGLTSREEEVLDLIRQGLSNKEIAAALCIAPGTVKTHIRNVMEKLHIRNRTQAAVYAARGKRLHSRRAGGR